MPSPLRRKKNREKRQIAAHFCAAIFSLIFLLFCGLFLACRDELAYVVYDILHAASRDGQARFAVQTDKAVRAVIGVEYQLHLLIAFGAAVKDKV